MGSVGIMRHAEGVSAGACFEALCERAAERAGHDPYNGEINSCRLGRCLRAYDAPTEAARKEAEALISRYFDGDGGEKGLVDYIDMGVARYEVTGVVRHSAPYTAKYRQKYVIRDAGPEDGFRIGRHLAANAFDTKTEADGKAVELALRTGRPFTVAKTMVRLEGNDTVTRVDFVARESRRRPRGGTFREIHEYVFFGWAPE